MAYTRQLARERISEEVYDSLITEADENESDLKEQLDYLITLRDDQKKTQGAIAYAERLLANIRGRLPHINQTPEELAGLPEEQRQAIMLERQDIIRTLCDKVIVYANGEITIVGLIEVKNITNVTPI